MQLQFGRSTGVHNGYADRTLILRILEIALTTGCPLWHFKSIAIIPVAQISRIHPNRIPSSATSTARRKR
jgi:hypothetical protein